MIPSINQKMYDKIKESTGEVETLIIIGKTDCKASVLNKRCNKKCLGKVYVAKDGKVYCPFPEGYTIKEHINVA